MKSPSTYTLFPYNPLLIPIAVICKHFKYARECGNGNRQGYQLPKNSITHFPFNPLVDGAELVKGSQGLRTH